MATSWTAITAGQTKITTGFFTELQNAGKNELARRGISYSYTAPTQGSVIKVEHLSTLRNALNNVRSRTWSNLSVGAVIAKTHFDEMRSHINLLEGKAKVGSDSGCSSGCTGLCQGCSGTCTGGCTGSCSGGCQGGCTACSHRWF